MRKTAILKDDLFLEHNPGFDHVESPARLEVIYEQLNKPEISSRFFFPSFEPASKEILALNHTMAHIDRVADTAGKTFSVLDPDTQTSPRSYDAACLAAGAVVKATQMVLDKETDNAFALVRPPGHHAEADRTSGFCLFNNIAVAAHYALSELKLDRVLIMDWDLHHGNGTQHSFYNTDKVLYFSTHQFPYFPGTGSLSETGSGAGEGYTINVPLTGGQDDRAFARIFNELLVPLSRQYKPQCIMVSAGFDTYFADPLGTMSVSSQGFAYMARVLQELADELCEGRLVVALEGGYNHEGLRDGVLAVLAELSDSNGLNPEIVEQMKNASVPLRTLEHALENAKRFWPL